jgi:hypothetical protein
MSYTTVVAGLVERLVTVSGLNANRVLDYEPTSIQDTPTVYMILDDATRTQNGQVTAFTYRVRARLCIKWQDNEFAEEEMATYVNSIPASIDADPQLGHRITGGMAQVVELLGEYISIGGTLYRVMNFFIEVKEKAGWQSGI